MSTPDSLDEFLANISEDGTHTCVVDTVSSSHSKKTDRDWIVIKYVVTDPSSDIDGEDLQEFFEDFNRVSLSDYNDMPAQAKRNIRDVKARWRERLISLGVAENDVSGYTRYDELMGREVFVEVETSIGNNGRKYVNIRGVSLATPE